MRAALKARRKALPDCLPNPPVGCVLARHDQIIASGYTQLPGEPHAEAMALSSSENCQEMQRGWCSVILAKRY
jgi:pyrimidine deaminase RibD-like protein